MSTFLLILSVFFLYLSTFFITDTIRRFSRSKSYNNHLKYEYRNGDLNNNTIITYLKFFSEILMCFPLISLIGWNWYFILPISFVLNQIVLPIIFTPIMFLIYPPNQILNLDGVYKYYYTLVLFGLIAYVIPIYFMSDEISIFDFSTGNIILALFVIIIFVSAILVFNNKSSKVSMLEKYEFLISNLLSKPNMEILSDVPSKTEIGYLFLGDCLMKIVLEEKNDKLNIIYHTKHRGGANSKEWNFDTIISQQKIYEEVYDYIYS